MIIHALAPRSTASQHQRSALCRLDEAELALRKSCGTPAPDAAACDGSDGDGDDETEPPLCGVGLELQPAGDGGWAVAAVRPGGPADVSGAVNPGDRILCIDGHPIQVCLSPSVPSTLSSPVLSPRALPLPLTQWVPHPGLSVRLSLSFSAFLYLHPGLSVFIFLCFALPLFFFPLPRVLSIQVRLCQPGIFSPSP